MPAGVDSSAPGWSAYGLGVQVLRVDGRTLVGHGGSMPGFLAGVFVDREEQIGRGVAGQHHDRRRPAGLRAAGRPARRRAADRRRRGRPRRRPVPLDRLGVWFWGPSPYVLRAVGGGRAAPGAAARPQRPGQPVHARRTTARWVGLDGYYAGETLRIADGPPRPGHLHLHPHALRPGGPGARRRRRARLVGVVDRVPTVARRRRADGVVQAVSPRPAAVRDRPPARGGTRSTWSSRSGRRRPVNRCSAPSRIRTPDPGSVTESVRSSGSCQVARRTRSSSASVGAAAAHQRAGTGCPERSRPARARRRTPR